MELAEIREEIDAIGRFSHTSKKFQGDLLSFVEDNYERGTCLIEVGCFHGGLTVQLAHVAQKLGLLFDVVDISDQYLEIARDTASLFSLDGKIGFHKTTLTKFVSEERPKPVLVFVDGDHRYEGVVADIRAIKGMVERPFACAFHDFSLRYADDSLSDVRVDKAILDEFGHDAPLRHIGEIAGAGQLRTSPGEDRHYHEFEQPEGVIVVLEGLD